MQTAIFITHPDVVIDPAKPVPRWRLSERGVARMREFIDAAGGSMDIRAVWASSETKAIEAAGLLAGHFGSSVRVDPDLGENDRSATGFLPPDEFERVADQFFAEPLANVHGWERAVDAQDRVVSAIDRILGAHGEGDVAIISHGGVGALLLCRYLNVPISRELDQPFQGHYWAFEIASRRVLHRWRPIAPR